jgi:hypothetical protein
MHPVSFSCVAFECKSLERSSSGQQVEDEYDDCEDDKEVHPTAECVTANESKNPEDYKDDGDCPKHKSKVS